MRLEAPHQINAQAAHVRLIQLLRGAGQLEVELRKHWDLVCRHAGLVVVQLPRHHVLGTQIPLGEQEEGSGGGLVGVEVQARPAPRFKLVLEIIPHYFDSL